MATQFATSRRRQNRLARRKYYKDKKIVRTKEEFEKTKQRIYKMLPDNAPPESFLRGNTYLEAKSCGIDLTTRNMRKKEPPKSRWHKKGRDDLIEGSLLNINDNAVCDWFQTLSYEQKVSLYLVCRKAFISHVDLKVEGLKNNNISNMSDFIDWGRIE